ncbi:MAG: serine/threonine-protein kinase PknK, partial [Cyanobacteria bacterium J06632_3]
MYKGTKTTVYRAVSTESKQQVVIKVLSNQYPTCRELTLFRHQYNIAKNLPVAGIVRPLALHPWQYGYALVLEDFGGISLRQYTADHALSVKDILGIAIQMADILKGLHEHQVVHKDIKPANILIHPDSKRIQLIDFSIATQLPKETLEIQSPNVLEGTLAYLSPEQTGRMNRGIDYRSDFYGLGITLYELLTKQLPFTETDPLELVHCHIAKAPVPPSGVISEIPSMVSQIVLKLIAKNAEDRYQSALGLKHDLSQCLVALKETGKIEAFELGLADVCDRFLIPEKLYGRTAEVNTLIEAFERTAYGGSELMLLAGLSGVGKTAVVNEVHRPITQRHGYFIRGKFDQFNRNIPFSAFVQAFRDLITQLLGETDKQLTQWKSHILDAVGKNGQLLIEVIPELQTVIGPQPPVEALPDTAAQARFHELLLKFVKVFTTPWHPLVLFLDDLQWADSASLSLLALLLGQNTSQTGHLLIIGAYRDNEIFPAHPLIQTLESISNDSSEIQTLTLTSLSQNDVVAMVSETLSWAAKEAVPLSQLIHQKTQGNPFFTTQFLKELHTKGCITFDSPSGRWQCDIDQIHALALTDDVVTFMVKRLRHLPKETQEAMMLAASIGNRFELSTLSAVCEASPAQVAQWLISALQERFIIPENSNYQQFESGDLNGPSDQTSNSNFDRNRNLDRKELAKKATDTDNPSSNAASLANSQSANSQPESATPTVSYRFLHDRVQQAAYALIPAGQQQTIHLKIGQLLLNHLSEEAKDNHLFTLVGQLNMGRSLITSAAERDALVQLNLKAGKKAKLSTAYSAAIEYFATAKQLLGTDSWTHNYTATLEVCTEALEAEYLNTHFEAIEQLSESILKRAQNLLDIIKVHEIRIRAQIGLGNQHQALTLGLDILQQLGITLLQHPPVAPDDIAALVDAAVMDDPKKLAAMDIMADIITAAWAVSPEHFRQLTFTMVSLSLTAGNAPTSPFGYAWYGSILCEALGDPASGYEFGKLAVTLVDRLAARSLRSKVFNLYASTIGLWQGHAKNYFNAHLTGIQSGLDSGDLEFASYNAAE